MGKRIAKSSKKNNCDIISGKFMTTSKPELNLPSEESLHIIFSDMQKHILTDYFAYYYISGVMDMQPETSEWFQHYHVFDNLTDEKEETDVEDDLLEDVDDDSNLLVFINSPLPYDAQDDGYGQMYGTVEKYIEIDPNSESDEENAELEHYVMQVISYPKVGRSHSDYFDPVSVEINYATADITFFMNPIMYQPAGHDDQEYRLSLSFYQDEEKSSPRWHTFKYFQTPEGDRAEEIDNFLTESEMNAMFLESAIAGSLPGFSKDIKGKYSFSAAHFTALSPAQHMEDYLSLIGTDIADNVN